MIDYLLYHNANTHWRYPSSRETDEAIARARQLLGWFLGEEKLLGTIEPGKYADLVVLSADYFDPKAVSDDAIKKIHSVLTVVDGKIVHGDPGKL